MNHYTNTVFRLYSQSYEEQQLLTYSVKINQFRKTRRSESTRVCVPPCLLIDNGRVTFCYKTFGMFVVIFHVHWS